jgi:hypothetical protein
MSVTLECHKRQLLAGRRQDVSFKITTEGQQTLFLILPVGGEEGDLLEREAFRQMKDPSIQGNDNKEVGIIVGKDDDASSDNTAGVLSITIPEKYSSALQTFSVVLSDCEVNARVGEKTISVRLEGMDGSTLATCDNIEKTLQRPQIKEFYASRYTASDQARVTLHWRIDPEGDYRLTRVGQEPPLRVGRAGNDTATVQISSATWDGEQRTRFKLEALTGATGENSREVIIYGYNQSAVKFFEGPGNGIVGCYAHEGKLYALARSATDGKSAGIWYSENGFDNWQPVLVGEKTPLTIPLQVAESPGVVFQDKLWLMGGSSYDPNRSTNTVCYYDFRYQTFIDDVAAKDGPLTLWPAELGARMGHALVVSPDGKQLWVMGGYDQSGGTKNDIWMFDGTEWKSLGKPKWEPRCMFGATTTGDSIWVCGGFQTTPGGKTYDDVWKWDAGGWREIRPSLTLSQQYCACALQFLGSVYAFTTYFDPTEQGNKHKISCWQPENTRWAQIGVESTDWALDRDYYSLQTVAYNGCIFIRKLARRDIDRNIRYFVRGATQ